MLAVISPAKRLDFESEPRIQRHTLPDFLDKSETIVKKARSLSRGRLAGLMNLSDTLADLNYRRYQDFSPPFNLGNAKQAALAFMGDTYVGLDAATLGEDDLVYAQDHLRIISGLYGLLRPLDLIQAYRLEMGTKFPVGRKVDLYDFWNGALAPALDTVTTGHADPSIVNLASNEYIKAINTKVLKSPVINTVFKEIKDNQARVIGMFAKQARGMMARHMITARVDRPDGLKNFTMGGYEFRDDLSDAATFVYTRQQPPPPKK